MTVREKELYQPVLELFGNDYFAVRGVQLGPKRIDLVLSSDITKKVIAIELKVSKWKQALRQALNYQLAADESYVAMFKKHSNPVDLQKFKSLGIGLITVDSESHATIKIPAKPSPRKQRNYSILLRAHIAEQKAKTSFNLRNNPSTSYSFKNYLWYVAIERNYYNEYADCYDGFLVNAHILAHYTSAFSALCLTLNKPFFIIPDTHFFQLAPFTLFLDTKGGIRSSWEKLAESYGTLIKLILNQGRNLETKDFVSKTGSFHQSLYDLVESVLSFQKDRVALATQGLARFFENPSTSTPTYLVAPYFYFASVEDPWYKISLEMTRESIKRKGTHNLFTLLCTSKSVLLSDNAISTIIDDFSDLELEGFLLWIQDFSETSEPSPLLDGLRRLVRKLKENDWKIINIHGGFFSSLMCYYGLNGVGYGICYKESDDPESFATGGPPGGPLPKYYLREIKIKLGKVETAVALNELPSLRCSCKICDKQIDYMLDAATPNAISKDLMKRHFLICKRDERDYICKSPLPQVLTNLDNIYKKYKKKIYLVPAEHLKRWVDLCKATKD